jgi:ureidoacrylate peracid hydrolase
MDAAMHDVRIPDDLVRRILRRRGRLHIHEDVRPPATALLVVDMQNAFVAPGGLAEVPMARRIVPNVNRLAAALRAAGGTVVWIRGSVSSARGEWAHYLGSFERAEARAAWLATLAPGAPGAAFWPDLDVRPDDPVVQKDRYSAFYGPDDLEAFLRRRGIDTVIVAGTLTNSCCESTARDAMQRDFRTLFVSDANAARTDEEHLATLCNLFNSFADVMTTDEVAACIARAGPRT